MRDSARTADHIGGQVSQDSQDSQESQDSPHAGGQGSPRRASSAGRWLGQLPYLAILAGVVAGLAVVRQGSAPAAVKNGTLVIAGALLLGALARLILPDQRAGLLAARSRRWDVLALAALGTGLLVAGLIYPVPS